MRELPLTEALRWYLEAIRALSQAKTASIFVPAAPGGSHRAILAHAGESTPVPELAHLEAAISFAGRELGPEPSSDSPSFFRSAVEGGVLVPLPSPDVAWAFSPASEKRGASRAKPGRRRTDVTHPTRSSGAWLGLRLATGRLPDVLDRFASNHLDPAFAGDDSRTPWWNQLLDLGGAIAAQTVQLSALLTDPVTGLPGRAALEVAVADELARSRAGGRSLCVLFVNPDGFAAVNERVGREAGDEIVREIVVRLRSVVRKSDLLARYGGVVCTVLLAETSLAVGRSVADKILEALAAPAFLNGSIGLDFSIGVAAFEPGDDGIAQSPDLFRRADEALNAAKRAGGGRVAVWEPGHQAGGFVYQDRLMGIFTGNMSRDYRNMALLWDAVNVMATTDAFESLAARVTERLYSAFLPICVAVFGRSKEGEPELIKGLARQPKDSPATTSAEMSNPRGEKRGFLERGFAQQGTLVENLPSGEGGNRRMTTFCYFVPLMARQQQLGCLYLEDSHALDSSDVLFLRALATQLALTLDRARLAAEDRRRLEEEGRRLRAEVDQLQEALQRSKLEYRSAEMEAVVATARRVAPTDATVLIMGESGPGKELLARAIHELSTRRNKPLLVVDCGSIAASLADSELFGHERGAYTGAQQRKIGRLAEGDGGTVLLDEIGELPLEIQSKLLRFVQEKQITTVGGTQPRKVDVRIIAATNRDLAAEVGAGRFREDLYHRLNVVRLVVAPLRERPEDILFLANLFLEKFSALHHKGVRRFSPESEALLLRHDWSGNVRELENRVMQAVILSEQDEVTPSGLGLSSPPELAPASAASSRSAMPEKDAGSSLVPMTAGPESAPPASDEELVERLRSALGEQIESALVGSVPLAMPLGRWLTNDLVLEAAAAAAGVNRRAAQRIGIPETTFRRLLESASQQARAGLAFRPNSWTAVRDALRALVRADDEKGRDLLQLARDLLLTEILARAPGDDRTGSALFGVSLPTFRLQASEVGTSSKAGSR